MINKYITRDTLFPINGENAWKIIGQLESIIRCMIGSLGNDYVVEGEVAIHKTATITNVKKKKFTYTLTVNE